MLENIIGQDSTVGILREELEGGCFPRSVLFTGPPYAGKLSTALEVVRILSCETRQGEWNCGCVACEQNRLLNHPSTLILGPKDFLLEILAASDVLRRTRKISARYLFIRSVRKLLKRFDPVLWENEQTKIKSAVGRVMEIEEALESLVPETPLPSEPDLAKELERIVGVCTTLTGYLPNQNIPVNQIRKVSYWAHLSSLSRTKAVILESSETMMESSRNALLKILEEPPADTYFFLLTTHKGWLNQTILSRLRAYVFRERSEADQGEVLKRIFKEEQAYRSLNDYFLAWRGINPDQLKEAALRFLGGVTEERAFLIPEEVSRVLSTQKGPDGLRFLLEEALRILQIELIRHQGEGYVVERLAQWCELIQNDLMRMRTLNLNPSLVVESLYYRLKEAV
jgi:DNA polymerase-3 subunit gamma/tau